MFSSKGDDTYNVCDITCNLTNDDKLRYGDRDDNDADTNTEPKDYDPDDVLAMGDRMELKPEGVLRFSSFNPNGIRPTQVRAQVQHFLDLEVDIQGFSEVNAEMLNTKVRQRFYDEVHRMVPHSRATWSTSQVPSSGIFKPGGTGLITTGRTVLRV